MLPSLIYNSGLLAAYLLFRLLALFHRRAGDFVRSRAEGRRQLAQWISGRAARTSRPVWLHAASAGELDQAIATARAIKDVAPDCPVVVSVFSLSVTPRETEAIDLVFHLPLDLPWSWSTMLDELKPLAFATMTWDIFPNLLRQLNAAKIPAFLANAALPADSWRLRPFPRWFFAPSYAAFDGIFAVNDLHAATLRQLAPAQKVHVCGDARYDQVWRRIEGARLPAPIARTLQNDARRGPVWILASTYAACDERILVGLRDLLLRHKKWRVWIFPHHVGEARLKEVETALAEHHLACIRLEELLRIKTTGAARIVLVDRIGVLAFAYRFARFCYVGGGFHHRVHNTAEPAACAAPVLCGPRIDYSPIAQDLARAGALLRCDDGHQLLLAADRWMQKPADAVRAGRLGQAFLQKNRGAAAAFVQRALAPLLPATPALRSRSRSRSLSRSARKR